MSTQQRTENDSQNISSDSSLRSGHARPEVSREKDRNVVYAQVDVDNEHVHFEMVPKGNEFMLWLTIRRGMSAELASTSLRQIADLIDRQGHDLLPLSQSDQRAFNCDARHNLGSQRLDYDGDGKLILPNQPVTHGSSIPR